jgi:hypothetical protein
MNIQRLQTFGFTYSAEIGCHLQGWIECVNELAHTAGTRERGSFSIYPTEMLDGSGKLQWTIRLDVPGTGALYVDAPYEALTMYPTEEGGNV